MEHTIIILFLWYWIKEKVCLLSLIHISLHHFWPDCAGIELGEYLKLTPEMNGMKCRVIYDGSGIKEISYEAYQMLSLIHIWPAPGLRPFFLSAVSDTAIFFPFVFSVGSLFSVHGC